MTFSTYGVVADALKQYWRQSNATRPSFGDLIDWLTSADAWYLDQMLNFALEQCKEQFCQALGWEGNSDLAGRGERALK